ncbi:hypothetical protein ACFYU8_29830 [Brevibacillus sp. NPDC003359]|uniref:hypothetical protein n=1 Tax=unclassified Brevibacillus TaxID=2684853 RepID=UPI003673D596
MKEIIQINGNQAFVDWDYIKSLTSAEFVSDFEIRFSPEYASSFLVDDGGKFVKFYIVESKLGSVYYAMYNKQEGFTVEMHSITSSKVRFFLSHFPNSIK